MVMVAAVMFCGATVEAQTTDSRALINRPTLTAGILNLTGSNATVLYTSMSGTNANVYKSTIPDFFDLAGYGPTDAVTFAGITTGTIAATTGTISALTVQSLTLNGSGYATLVSSVAGTPGQVLVSGTSGGVTFSLPQSISTTASPTFGGLISTTIDNSGAALLGSATVTNGLTVLGDLNVGGNTTLTGLTMMSSLTATGLAPDGDPVRVTMMRSQTLTAVLNSVGKFYFAGSESGPYMTYGSGATISLSGSLSMSGPFQNITTTGTLRSATLLNSGAMTVTGNLSLPSLTDNRVLGLSGGAIVATAVTPTTLAFLDATSSVQTQLDAKQALLGSSSTLTVGGLISTTHINTGLGTFGSLSVTGSSTLIGNIASTGYLGLGGPVSNTAVLRAAITNSSHKGVSIVAATGQTSDVIDVLNSSGTQLFRVSGAGRLVPLSLSIRTDAPELTNRYMTVGSTGTELFGVYTTSPHALVTGDAAVSGAITVTSGLNSRGYTAIGDASEVASSLTLTSGSQRHTLIMTTAATLTLSTASTMQDREICIINQSGATGTLAGGLTTTVPTGCTITVISGTATGTWSWFTKQRTGF